MCRFFLLSFLLRAITSVYSVLQANPEALDFQGLFEKGFTQFYAVPVIQISPSPPLMHGNFDRIAVHCFLC